jgi:hypothetical protein
MTVWFLAEEHDLAPSPAGSCQGDILLGLFQAILMTELPDVTLPVMPFWGKRGQCPDEEIVTLRREKSISPEIDREV